MQGDPLEKWMILQKNHSISVVRKQNYIHDYPFDIATKKLKWRIYFFFFPQIRVPSSLSSLHLLNGLQSDVPLTLLSFDNKEGSKEQTAQSPFSC